MNRFRKIYKKNSVTWLPFRVKMCTAVTMPELIVVHHELGHVWYFMMYRDQPTTFQEGANPGRLETFCKNSYPLPTHPYHLTGKFGKSRSNKSFFFWRKGCWNYLDSCMLTVLDMTQSRTINSKNYVWIFLYSVYTCRYHIYVMKRGLRQRTWPLYWN